MEALIIEYAKRYGIQKAIEYFGLDKQNANPKYAISLGNFSFDPVGAAKRAVLNTGLKSAFSGNLSGIMGPAVMLGGALMLGRAFDPMRPGSINYSPNLRGQVDFLSRQDGMLSTNPGTGGMVYGPGSVLAGKNVSSMFGTNNYQKALDKQIDYFEKQKQKKGFLTKYQQKRLDDTKKEKKDFFDYRADVRDAAKTKYGGSYKGPPGKDVHGGGNISGSVSRGGTDDTPGTPFRRGGIASL